jgi:hypothetical protein
MAIITPKIQHWLNTRTEPVPDSIVKSESERIEREKQEEREREFKKLAGKQKYRIIETYN